MRNEGSLSRTYLSLLGSILLLSVGFARGAAPARPARPAVFQSPPRWERVRTDDEDFSVYMPARPSVHEKEGYFYDGVKVSHALIAAAYHDGAVFVARVFELPELKELSADRLSGNCLRLADLRAHKGLSKEGRDLERQGFRGKEYLKQGDGYAHTVQCFATKRRFYVVEAAARNKDGPVIKRFLSSLSLGGEAAPAGPPDDAGLASPAVETDASKAYGEKEVARAAVVVNRPHPRYPGTAAVARIGGEVRLRVLFLASGEVGEIEVLKGRAAGLTESAVEAARKIKFIPAEKDGRLVSQYAEVVYRFGIQ